jgi:hypothetical protein
MARAARLLVYGLVLLALALAFSAMLPAGAVAAAPRLLRAEFYRGVPPVTPGAAGLFRIIFGAGVLAYIVATPLDLGVLQSYEVDAAGGLYGRVMRSLGAQPAIAQHLDRWLYVSGALFVAGVVTPLSYACFVAGFLLWASILTLTTSAHAVASIAIAMICLLAARWGDGLSVDALVRRLRRGHPWEATRSQRYGYAIWIPRLVLGVTFLAAAWSKVRGGGPDWVLNGTVKYHFATDFAHAMVPWGMDLAAHHWVAVMMSAGALVVESLAITAAFSRSSVYVLALGAGALALLAGFALFQGVLWWGWWILLVAFLPWQHVRVRWPWRRVSTPSMVPTFGLPRLQAALVVLVLVQQAVASAFHIEARPMFSAYDMYSATYASIEEFEEAANLVYRVVLFDRSGAHDARECLLSERDAALFVAAHAGDAEARALLRPMLRRCVEREPEIRAVALEGDRAVFNWNARRLEPQRAVDVIGPFAADWLRE